MTSFEDASLVLSKWRDESALLDFVLADSRWLTVMARCTVTGFERFMLTVENESTRISLGLAKADFRYEDRRAKLRFIRKDVDLRDAVCALRVKFPTGAIAILVELKGIEQ